MSSMGSEGSVPRPAVTILDVSGADSSGADGLGPELLGSLEVLVAFLYGRLHLGPGVELNVTLVDEDRMERLHMDWMDLPGPTDVMSFPMDELSPGTATHPVEEGLLGDVVLCPGVARRQAHAAGHDLADELMLLTVHGVLHLLGHDHAEQDEKRVMFALQSRLLEDFLGRPSPTPTDVGS